MSIQQSSQTIAPITIWNVKYRSFFRRRNWRYATREADRILTTDNDFLGVRLLPSVNTYLCTVSLPIRHVGILRMNRRSSTMPAPILAGSLPTRTEMAVMSARPTSMLRSRPAPLTMRDARLREDGSLLKPGTLTSVVFSTCTVRHRKSLTKRDVHLPRVASSVCAPIYARHGPCREVKWSQSAIAQLQTRCIRPYRLP